MMLSQDLDILPSPNQFRDALLYTLDKLQEGDSIDVHEEASPPWFRIVAADGETIANELRSQGVRVEDHRL